MDILETVQKVYFLGPKKVYFGGVQKNKVFGSVVIR